MVAAALGVSCDYLLTGEGERGLKPLPTEALPADGGDAQKRSPKENPIDVPKQKEATGVYRLRLHQVTHNHLTKWVLLINVLVLILTIVCGPVSLRLGGGEEFGSITALAFLYEQITESAYFNGWAIAVGVIWIIVLAYVATSSLVMIFGTLNGANEYYVKTSAIQLCGIFAVFVLSSLGSYFSNLYEGETVMRVDLLFACLLILNALQLVLNVLISRHGKRLNGFKQAVSVSLAVLLAITAVGCALPLGVAMDEVDESTVEFSDAELEVSERLVSLHGTSWYEYSGSCILAVSANAKITYLYDGTVKFSTDNYTQTLFVNNEYLKTKYVGKRYYSFFKVAFTASGKDDEEAPERIENFNLFFSVIDGGKVFELTTNTEVLSDSTVDFAEVERIGGELETGRLNAIYGVYLKNEARITGWQASPNTDLAVYASSVEYSVLGEVDGKKVFIPEYTYDWKSLKNDGEDISIPLKWQKYAGGYAEVGVVQIKIEVLKLSSLKQTARVKLFTDIGTVVISLPIDINDVIDSYI